jgi:hypothetical protein
MGFDNVSLLNIVTTDTGHNPGFCYNPDRFCDVPILGRVGIIVMAATLPILPDPVGEVPKAMWVHRRGASTHRAGKIGASRRVSAKIAVWFVEALDRMVRYALRASPATRRFFVRNAAHEDYVRTA